MLASRPSSDHSARLKTELVDDPSGRGESSPLQSRARVVQRWLGRPLDNSVGRLVRQWFRTYFKTSRNSGAAATIYLLLSAGPLVLAATGLFHAAGGDANAVAGELIEHQRLTGDTANLVRQTFGTASHNALATSVAGLVGFLIWGPGIGRIYQDVYARAWHVEVRSLSDPLRFTVWFFVLGALLCLFFAFAGSIDRPDWTAAIPVYVVVSTAFWIWTPRYLLRGRIGFRPLLPGAFLATLVLGGATATSQFFLGPSLNSDARYFGSFGVVIALLAWCFILTTISVAGAIFSAVWRECRSQGEPHMSVTNEPRAADPTDDGTQAPCACAITEERLP